MQAHAEKIIIDTISTQIKNLKDNADVYKAVHGETVYNNLLVSCLPSFFQNPKRTLNILSYALQVCREISFEGRILTTGIRTNRRGPAKVSIITD